jgi:Transposase DDE domain
LQLSCLGCLNENDFDDSRLFFSFCPPQLLDDLRRRFGRGSQGKERVAFAVFVGSLVSHALSATGSLGHHLRTMSKTKISDASAQERRAGLSWDWFCELFKHILVPLARPDTHTESFYQGLRLLGIDGTQWSLRNTKELDYQGFARSTSGKGAKGAFCKWVATVLLELGTHHPLYAACSQPQVSPSEGESTLAHRTLEGLPQDEDTLLLADRLYGCPTFITAVQKAASGRCHLLVRVKSNYKGKVLEHLPDGSVIIEVNSRDQRGKGGIKLRLREIRGKVKRLPKPGEVEAANETAGTELRLWTTLLDAGKYQAQDLLELYAQRWEQELFFHELKRHTGRENLLRSGTVQGLQAEFGAMLIAASVLARQRLAAGDMVGVGPLRISLTKISRGLEALLPVLEVAGDLISDQQRQQMIERFMEHTAQEAVIPKRRSRSCQRGLRKPVCAWPRIRTREYTKGQSVVEIIVAPFP